MTGADTARTVIGIIGMFFILSLLRFGRYAFLVWLGRKLGGKRKLKIFW